MVGATALRLLCWNVLADAYVTSRLYGHCDPRALDPGSRRQRILAHVLARSPDVICLQEVEPGLFDALSRELARSHSGVFGRKALGKPDGCATFVRTEGHDVEHRVVHYSDGSGHLALLTWVRSLGRTLLVANTHLKWDPPGTEQALRHGVRQADEVCALLLGDATATARVVCGDFNVVADDPVVGTFLERGFVDPFASSGEPTCIANGRARRIDFVLVAGDLRPVPEPVPLLRDGEPLPSLAWPSDHVPLEVALRP